jgi:hypothetical protein
LVQEDNYKEKNLIVEEMVVMVMMMMMMMTTTTMQFLKEVLMCRTCIRGANYRNRVLQFKL